MGRFEKIFRLLSAILVAVFIVNSFLFAAIANPKPAEAFLDPSGPLLVAIQGAWEIISTAFDKAKKVADDIFQGETTAFNVWSKSEDIMTKVSATLLYITMNLMLAKMTNDITAWINGGAKGSPKVTQDFKELFSNALDQAAGSVVGDILGLPNGELCDPQFLKVNLSLSLDTAQAPTFQEKLKCSFSEIGTNIENFKNDFTQGGWKGWVRYGEGANNNLGAM
ncbi:hypothetical protein HY249_02595, partial [Candidatus Azambacteria bacterium]|nr:hypothetical protein [Candidatus Azambacteria bacterium]